MILFIGVEVCTPVNYYTHRFWEALEIQQHKQFFWGTFYPNFEGSMVEQGDLAYRTNYAIPKNVTWKLDELGFRNDHYVKDPEILLIGDSFILGSSLSQDQTLSSQLASLTNKKVYQIASVPFSVFTHLYKNGKVDVPKYVIYSCVERKIPDLMPYNINVDYPKYAYKNIHTSTWINSLAVGIDRLTRLYSIKYLEARLKKSGSKGIQSPIYPKMFFYEGKSSLTAIEDSIIERSVNQICSYKHFCDSIGAKFIFIPSPNKETVYWEMVPFEQQPAFLSILCSRLEEKNVSTINPLVIYNYSRKNNDHLLYHLDDTHWNARGVKLLADSLSIRISD